MTEEPEEECESCKLAVGIGMYLNVCKVIDSKEKCEELFDKVKNDEIEPNELFELIKEKAKGKTEHMEMLEYIDELMEKTKT